MDLLKSPIHDIIFIVSFLGIILAIVELKYHPDRRAYIIAPLTYLVNVFLYNFALHFNLISYSYLEIWSGIVRLHSLFLFIAYIIFEPKRRKGGA